MKLPFGDSAKNENDASNTEKATPKSIACVTEYELEDGEFITMSAAPILLKRLKSLNKKEYITLSKFVLGGINTEDALELFQGLYAAYVAANVQEELMDYDEFLERANQSYTYNAEKVGEMLLPKKK